MKKKTEFMFLTFAGMLAAALCFSSCKDEESQKETSACCEKTTGCTTFPANEKLLSRHDAKAVFKGTRQHRCHGMTMLCPDKCGDSGTLAVFGITGYNDYQKADKYGDEPATEYMFMLQSTTGTSDVSPELAKLVENLKPGDEVNLVWDHVYVSDASGSFPKRIVRKIEALGTRDEAQDSVPANEATPMPASRMAR